MGNLEVSIASNDSLDIRHFSVREGMSSLFIVSIVAVSRNQSIDFDAVVGKPARFTIRAVPLPTGREELDYDPLPEPRFWDGICSQIHEVDAEETGVATYQLTIVHRLWLLTQRTNYRIFQQLSEPAIALKLLDEWRIEPEVRFRLDDYKKRKYKVQYAESDFDFLSRMLEEAGVAYYFRQDGEATRLVLSDKPQSNDARKSSLRFVDNPSLGGLRKEYVTAIHVTQKVRPGRFVIRDHDYRRQPDYKLIAEASGGLDTEQMLERFQYSPGAFLFGVEKGDETPSADDKGKARTDEREGAALAQKRLESKRAQAKRFSFGTNALDLAPGAVIQIVNHPRADLGEGKRLLVLTGSIDGTTNGEWVMNCEAMSADVPYRPPLATKKPTIAGVESATVVGPKGEEIHTDEFGRVRVHFHWDRESQMDDNSSCWIHVSQPWAGAGYGGTNLPRVGQEVLVDFLGGDPDRPIITGRIYTNLQKTPYKLPENKTQSGWKSSSTGGTGGSNHIMFEDKAGSELVSMQAERDQQSLVKRNADTTVGSNKTTVVGKNHNETVHGDQCVLVGSHRTVTVTGESTYDYLEGVTMNTPKNTSINTKGAFSSASKTTKITAEDQLLLVCGESTIFMTPSFIIVQATNVHINPGAAATKSAIENGTEPKSDSQKEADDAKAKAEQEQRDREDITERNARRILRGSDDMSADEEKQKMREYELEEKQRRLRGEE